MKTVKLTDAELELMIEILDYYALGTLTGRNAPEDRGKIREKLVYALYPDHPNLRAKH